MKGVAASLLPPSLFSSSTHPSRSAFSAAPTVRLRRVSFSSAHFFFVFFILSSETRDNPTAFRNTSERKKGPNRLVRAPQGFRSTCYYLPVADIRMYMVHVPVQPMKTPSPATTTSISIGAAPCYNTKTTLSPWAALPPYGYISFIPSSLAKDVTSFFRHRCGARSITPSLRVGDPLPKLGFFLRPARVQPTKRRGPRCAHTWHKQRMTTATTNKLLHPPSK